MGKVRIKDIAEIANVSIGTVDRVIHNRGEVSLTTREKILKLLEEHHYEPDINASSLALKRQVHLAVIIPGVVNDHAFWKIPQMGVDKALNEMANYNISVLSIKFDQFSKLDFIEQVRNFPFDSVHGVLFAPVFQKESVDFIRECEQHQVPVVLINSLLEESGVRSYVGQDAFQSGLVAAKLINFGIEHRKDVAIINMSSRKDHYAHIISRERGFRAYFEEHSDRLDHLVTIDLNGADDDALKGGLDDLFVKYEIGGLFVTNSRVYKVADYLASKGSMAVRLVGYDLMPESIAYLQRDYIDFLISQKPDEQAFIGLNALFNLVAFNREPEDKHLMPIDIITRENLSHYNYKTL
jgi:LacI family transcriptional regulator